MKVEISITKSDEVRCFLMDCWASKKDGVIRIEFRQPIRVEDGETLGIRVLDCTCPKSCGMVCKGSCGCQSCSDAYSDFLSGQGN